LGVSGVPGKIVQEVTSTLKDHVHLGDVKITMRDANKNIVYQKSFPATKAWEMLEDEVKNGDFISKLKQSSGSKIEFTGLHNWETVAKNSKTLE
jgi:hypothetical protein